MLIYGLKSYQHPRRYPWLTPRDDHFPGLVIYISLLALAVDVTLWEDCNCEDRDPDLLFAAHDLEQPRSSELFERLRKSASPMVRGLAAELFDFCQRESSNDLPSLEQVLAQLGARPPIEIAADMPDIFNLPALPDRKQRVTPDKRPEKPDVFGPAPVLPAKTTVDNSTTNNIRPNEVSWTRVLLILAGAIVIILILLAIILT